METNAFVCQVCTCPLQKDDAQFVDLSTFPFLHALPNGLKEGAYCLSCFETHVHPEIENYNARVEQAKDVNVFFAKQGKETRFVRRTEKPVKVENCEDRDEVILRLAYLAVEAHKNSLVDLDLTSKKVKSGRWQTTLWSGTAIPVDIDEASLARRFPGTPN